MTSNVSKYYGSNDKISRISTSENGGDALICDAACTIDRGSHDPLSLCGTISDFGPDPDLVSSNHSLYFHRLHRHFPGYRLNASELGPDRDKFASDYYPHG